MAEDLDINNPVIAQMLRGERPEGMKYEEFKLKKKAIDAYIKRKRKGKFIHISKELSEIKDEEGKTKEVIKSYGPYKRKTTD